MKKILISRTDRIGDLLLSTPVFQSLKKAHPKSHLAVMVTDTTRELLKNDPHVDEIICFRPRDYITLVRRLTDFDVAIVLYPTFAVALLCWLARIKLRIGTAYRVYSFLFNRRVREHRKVCAKHEAEYNMSLLEPLEVQTQPPDPVLRLADEEVAWAKARFAELGVEGAVVALHPGSGGSSRRWGDAGFSRLGDLLCREGFTVLLTGGDDEVELVSDVADGMECEPLTIVGEASLLQLAAVYTRCAALVTNSTGPMHMAAASGIPVVGIFCPIAGCSPRRWGPLGDHARVLIPDVPTCRQCTGTRCEYHDCMDMVLPEDVLKEVKSLVTLRRAEEGCGTPRGKAY